MKERRNGVAHERNETIMPIREESWAPGTPAWVDLTVSDVERSQKFYAQVLGWEFQGGEEEFGGYLNATVQGQIVAGMAPPMPGMGDPVHQWTTYLAVASSAQAESAITAAGAEVLFGSMQVGPFGTMALYADPTGAVFGTWESASHTGYNLYNEPGSVMWNEAMVGDFEAGRAFYSTVFNYTYQDVPMDDVHYAMVSVAGHEDPVAGIGLSEGMPPHWALTFAVADAGAAIEAATAHGGEVVAPVAQTEFGQLAVLKGPDGELFAVMGSATEEATGSRN